MTIDNIKSEVHKAHIYDPVTSLGFVEFANHYGFAVVPARTLHLRDKAKNEAGIGVIPEYNDNLAVHAKRGNREIYSTHEAHYPEHKVQTARFEVKHAFAETEKAGPETKKLMEALLSGSHTLRYLRRAQGILRLVQIQKVSAGSLEHACHLGLLFNKTQYEFIKSATEQHEANG